MNPVAFNILGKDIYWYGIIIASALVVGVILGVREAKRRGYRSEMIFDFLLIAIPLCIVCARLYYVVFEWSSYAGNFLKMIAIWEGGLAIYGAVIGGVIAAFIFFKWRRVPIGGVMDIAAPSIIIGQAIGRWGNFVNQEAYGEQISYQMRALKFFPAGIKLTLQNGTVEWHYATFFYESMWNLLVFIGLMIIKTKIKLRGGVFAWYVILYGFGRFWIEGLRTDSLYWGPIRVSQALSLVLIIAGIVYIVTQSRKYDKYPAYEGFYSLDWTEEQIEDYRKHSKLYRAKDAAQRLSDKVKALKDADKNVIKAANDKVKQAEIELEAVLKDHDEESKAAIKAEEMLNSAKAKLEEIEKQIELAKENEALVMKKEEALKKLQEKAKAAKEKVKVLEETDAQEESQPEEEEAADEKKEDEK